MKKLIFIMMMVMVAAAVCADGRTAVELRAEYAPLQNGDGAARAAWYKSLSEAEWRLLADEFIAVAVTNRGAATNLRPLMPGMIFTTWGRMYCPLDEAEWDAKISGAGISLPPASYNCLSAPRSTMLWLDSTNSANVAWITAHPVRVAILRSFISNKVHNASFAMMANSVAELIAYSNAMHFCTLDIAEHKKALLKRATKAVKRALRERGQSFVAKNGRNPVQEAIDTLTAALNAPKMAGLKEWVAEWIPDYTWIEPHWMSDAEIAAIKNDIMYGEKEFTVSLKFTLCGYLGVEAYNAFVKLYNGEE